MCVSKITILALLYSAVAQATVVRQDTSQGNTLFSRTRVNSWHEESFVNAQGLGAKIGQNYQQYLSPIPEQHAFPNCRGVSVDNSRPHSCPIQRLRASLAKRTNSLLPLTQSDQQRHWFANINIGGIDMRTLFDSSRSDIYIVNSKCTSPSCAGRRRYKPPKLAKSLTFTTKFGRGKSEVTWSGISRELEISFLKFKVRRWVGVIDKWEGPLMSFDSFPFDAIVGVGFPATSWITPGQPTLLQELYQHGWIAEPLIAFRYSRGDSSEVSFGATNDAISSVGSFATVPVDVKDGRWLVTVQGVTVNRNQRLGSLPALVDTGSFAIYAPEEFTKWFYTQIDGAKVASPDHGPGFWVYPVKSKFSFSFHLGNREFTMNPRTFPIGQFGDMLIGGLVAAPLDDDVGLILGTGFLRNFYSVLHMGGTQKDRLPSLRLEPVRVLTVQSSSSSRSTRKESSIDS